MSRNSAYLAEFLSEAHRAYFARNFPDLVLNYVLLLEGAEQYMSGELRFVLRSFRDSGVQLRYEVCLQSSQTAQSDPLLGFPAIA